MMESIPALARDVLQLFDDRLEGRRFGDLDRGALHALAETAQARAHEVTEARVALEAAQAELDRAKSELTRRADQALAYARIHGADDAAVADAVARIDASRASRKAPTRRRKRAPKKASTARPPAELPFDASAPAVSAGAVSAGAVSAGAVSEAAPTPAASTRARPLESGAGEASVDGASVEEAAVVGAAERGAA